MEIKNNSIPNKRDTIQYFDLFFGLYNSFVMSFMIIIILGSLTLVIIAHIFIIIMITGIYFTYLKNNPFFMYFIMGTLLCGAFYSLPGILIIPTTNFMYGIFDYIIFGVAILEIFYIMIKLKDSDLFDSYSNMALVRDRGQYIASIYNVVSDPASLEIQKQKALEDELIEKGKQEEYYKKYKRTWILSISVISVIGYFMAYFSSFGL